jgi:anti-anti-sigma factor
MGNEVLRITQANGAPGLIIAGEIDESSYPLLLQSLASLNAHRDVHIDLGGVEFCDLAGLRAIVCVTEQGTGDTPAGRLTLHAVPERLRRILEILGWQDMPGVAFTEQRLQTGHEQHASQ